jgi:hypothetical protein
MQRVTRSQGRAADGRYSEAKKKKKKAAVKHPRDMMGPKTAYCSHQGTETQKGTKKTALGSAKCRKS